MRTFCSAPHPTELHSCSLPEGHRGRNHVCDVEYLGEFGDEPRRVYLRWRKDAPIDYDSPARRHERVMAQPVGTPEQERQLIADIMAHARSLLDDQKNPLSPRYELDPHRV